VTAPQASLRRGYEGARGVVTDQLDSVRDHDSGAVLLQLQLGVPALLEGVVAKADPGSGTDIQVKSTVYAESGVVRAGVVGAE
jgi:hypothetical protein